MAAATSPMRRRRRRSDGIRPPPPERPAAGWQRRRYRRAGRPHRRASAPQLGGEAREVVECGGRLVSPGFVETHIHLDKSRIIDRCAARPSAARIAPWSACRDSQAHLHGRGCHRARAAARWRTASSTAPRACAPMSRSIPRSGCAASRACKALVDDYAWAIDLEICVMPQEGLTNNPGTDELMVEALKRGATRGRRGAQLRHRPGRADPPRLRDGARIRRRYRHASRLRHLGRRSRHAAGLRADREIRLGRPRRDRPCLPSSRPCRRPTCDKVAQRHRPTPAWRVTVLPATDLYLVGRDQRPQRAARRGRCQPAGRAWRELLDLHQQHPQSLHAVRRRLADAHGQPAGQCDARSATPSGCANASRC